MNTYEIERSHIARHFKQIRIKKGWSQNKMALYLNLSRPAYTRYETGVNNPPADKYLRATRLIDEGGE